MKAKTFYGELPEEVGYFPTPDGTTVRFRENIEEVTGVEEPTWAADEYSVFLRCKEDVARSRVEANTALWLAKAKEAAEPPVEKPTLDDITAALVELAELIGG